MKWKPYPRYKDSGVESLSLVPEKWRVMPLKHLGGGRAVSIQMGPFGSMLTNLASGPTGFRLFGQQNTISGDFTVGDRWLAEDDYHRLRKYALRPGDIVLTRKGSLGKARLVPDGIPPGIADSDTIRIRLMPGAPSPELIVRLLHEAPYLHTQIEQNARGAILDGLNTTTIGNLKLAVPTPDEDLAICGFLELELDKIDRVISKQQGLIELLQEKRQTLISHAVTKGLNPDALTKPSGVDWLGEVPSHWNVKPVKLLAHVGNGSTPDRENPLYWTGDGYPWLNSSVVNREDVTEAEQFVTPLALRECHLPKIVPPAVLIGITGEGRTRGTATTLRMEATINQHVVFVKPRPLVASVDFLRRVFDMAYQHLRWESDAGGSTKGAITCNLIQNLRVPVPPLGEQEQIAAHISKSIQRLGLVLERAGKSITLMQERRAALISAAVTGKIDLRDVGESAHA